LTTGWGIPHSDKLWLFVYFQDVSLQAIQETAFSLSVLFCPNSAFPPQTLEQLKQPKDARIEWQQCNQLPPEPDKFDPDEDTWHYLATQKLANQKTPKVNNAKLPKAK
jgi:hypothetical protein